MKLFFTFLIFLVSIVACSPNVVSTEVAAQQERLVKSLDSKSSLQTSNAIPTYVESSSEQPVKTLFLSHPTSTPTATLVQEVDDHTLGTALLMFGNRYDYRQYEGVRHALEKADYRIVIASNTLQPIEAMYVHHGFEYSAPPSNTLPQLSADLLLEQVQIGDYDAYVLISDEELVFKGGTEVNRIIREAIEQGKVVAANDAAVLVLGNAGILEGVEITSNPLICMQLAEEDGAICRQMTVHRDGQIVTAGPDHASSSFAKQIIAAIQDSR